MASLSIAVEAVDKRLDRLRAIIPKSHEDVADLLAQYGKVCIFYPLTPPFHIYQHAPSTKYNV
jgi:hypothetical protein